MVICPVCPLQVCQHPCEQTQQWMRGWGALKKGKSPNQLIYGDGRHQETIGLEYNHLFAAVPPRYVESVLYWCAAWAGCMESKRSRDLSYGSTGPRPNQHRLTTACLWVANSGTTGHMQTRQKLVTESGRLVCTILLPLLPLEHYSSCT